MYDIIIVGAGPSGLTAAIYATRASKKVLVLESKSYGGQIINSLDIENYPTYSHISGFDFATNIYNQAVGLGAEIKFEKVTKISDLNSKKEVITSKDKYISKAVIIATGTENRKLGLDGEDTLIGKGISYCATCDGAFYKNKIVAVIGGGNTAVEDALYLSDIAKKVYLIHRRDELKAEDTTIEKLKEKENVEFIYNSNVTKLLYDNSLNGIEITDKNGNINKIELDGLFVAVGRKPVNDVFKELLSTDEYGYIISNEECTTNKKGIFASGDVRKKDVRQLVTATSDGAVSAISAIKYIND